MPDLGRRMWHTEESDGQPEMRSYGALVYDPCTANGDRGRWERGRGRGIGLVVAVRGRCRFLGHSELAPVFCPVHSSPPLCGF